MFAVIVHEVAVFVSSFIFSSFFKATVNRNDSYTALKQLIFKFGVICSVIFKTTGTLVFILPSECR